MSSIMSAKRRRYDVALDLAGRASPRPRPDRVRATAAGAARRASPAEGRRWPSRPRRRCSSTTAGFSASERNVVKAGSPLRPLGDGLVLDLDQRGQVRPSLTDHHRVADVRAEPQLVLDLRRRQVTGAAGTDHMLLTVGDHQPPGLVVPGDVAGAVPPVGQQRLAACARDPGSSRRRCRARAAAVHRRR